MSRNVFPSVDGVGVFFQEQVLVETNFRIDGMVGRNPVDGRLHFAAVGRVAATGFGIIGAVDFGNGAGVIFDDMQALNEVSAA